MSLSKRLLASLVVFILFFGLSFAFPIISIDIKGFWIQRTVEILPKNAACTLVYEFPYKAGFPYTFVDNQGPGVCGGTMRYNPVALIIDILLVLVGVSLLFFLLSKKRLKSNR